MTRTTRRPQPDRGGFTLVEMMMAVLLTTIVFAITIPFFRMQTRAVEAGAGKLDAVQNARYAQAIIDREVRMAGGIVGQPIIVQAAAFSLAFNVDLVTRFANDASATYYDPTADSLTTDSWQPGRAKALPTSASKMYPAVFYTDASGIQSPAETITYFAKVDNTTGRTDLYTLFRRVNDRDSTVVARNLWIPSDTNYLFKYSRVDSSGAIVAVPQASLPIYWDNATKQADSIRMVTMRLATLYRDNRLQKDIVKTMYSNTKLLNAGMLRQNTCGTEPLGPTNVVATQVYVSGTLTKITVTWDKSLEETAGEKDVALYVIMRRPAAGTDWEVLSNLVANNSASYAWDDYTFQSGAWVYGVISQDCSPANSPVVAAAQVTNP
jgi:type II secretory pathway pseudopilin PulG